MNRRAFSLPEVLVAIIVLCLGILGFAASGTFLVTALGDATAMTEGAILAGTVLDSLRSLACGSVAAGSASGAASAVRWTATPAGPVIAISATMSIARRRGTRQVDIDTLLPC